MKKLLAVIACLVLAVTTFAFTACGNNSEGTIPGNYKEATDEEIDEALKKIDNADLSSLKGVEISLNIESSMSGLMNVDAEGSLKYQLAMGETLAGKGSASIDAKMSSGGDSADYDISADIYNDASYAYVNATGLPVPGMSELKAKFNLQEIIAGFMGGYALTDTNDKTEISAVTAYLELVKDACTIALDTSDGVKIKISLDENGLWKILEEIEGSETVDQIKASGSIEKFVCEFYFAIDADGKFAGAAANINVKATAKVPATQTSTTDQTMEISITLNVSEYTGSVTLPSGIATDSSYQDMTDLIGGGSDGPAYDGIGYNYAS